MKTFAVIENEKVFNVIVADSLKLANGVVQTSNPLWFCVDITDNAKNVGIGWSYINEAFIAPEEIKIPKIENT